MAAEAVNEVAIAQTVGAGLERLKAAAQRSDSSAAEAAAGLAKVRAATLDWTRALASFTPPWRR